MSPVDRLLTTHPNVHVRTPFPYLGNGWTDCAGTWCVVRGPLSMRFKGIEEIHTSARVTVHTFKHICSLLLVHRAKGVLLVMSDVRYLHFGTYRLPCVWAPTQTILIEVDKCLTRSIGPLCMPNRFFFEDIVLSLGSQAFSGQVVSRT